MEEIAKALNAFQAELVSVGKTADNPFFKSKYADLGSIMKEAQPVLTKHGLAVVQLPTHIDGAPALSTIVMHTSGQSIDATVPLVLAKNDPQGLGSAITYQRRYAYAAALQIVIDEDDDGNKASRPQTRTAPPVKATAPVEELASDIQRRQIKAFMTALGVAEADIPGVLASDYGVKGKLTKKEALRVLKEMQ